MDSRTEEVGRKRRLAPRVATPSKRLKVDGDVEGKEADELSNDSDGGYEISPVDSVPGKWPEAPHNTHLRSRDALSDEQSHDPFPDFKGSRQDITAQVRSHVKDLLTLGRTTTTLTDKDVILVAKAPETPTLQAQGNEESEELSKTKSPAKQFRRTQISENVVMHCATTLSKGLIGLTAFVRPKIAEVLPFSKQDFCYLLRYSSEEAAAENLTKIQTEPCKIHEFTIPLQGLGPDVLREPSLQGRLLPACPEEKQIIEAMIRFVLKEKSMLSDFELEASQTHSTATEEPYSSRSEERSNLRNGVNSEKQTDYAESNLAEDYPEKHLKTDAVDSFVDGDKGFDNATLKGTTKPDRDKFTAVTSIRLQDLPENERNLQTRYWGITDDEDLARCPVCSEPGHMSAACPSRTCDHCGATDLHFSANCPTRIKCPKCRERGHDVARCQSKLMRTAADGYDCDLCHGDHKDEDCSWIWRTFDPTKIAPEKLKKAETMIVFCYECGSSGHWGDDCLGLPKSKAKLSTNDVFSAKFANQFLEDPSSGPAQQVKQGSMRRTSQKPLDLGEHEADDLQDASNFMGKKINKTLPPRPKIQVNTQQGHTNGFKPINAYTSRLPPNRPLSYRSVPPPHELQYYPRNPEYRRGRYNYNFDEDRYDNGPRKGYGIGGRRYEQYPRSVDQARDRHVDSGGGDGNRSGGQSLQGSGAWTQGPRRNYYG